MSEAALENRAITAGDVRKALKQLRFMRSFRANKIERALQAGSGRDYDNLQYLIVEERALQVAISILEEGRDEVFAAIATRLNKTVERNAGEILLPDSLRGAGLL